METPTIGSLSVCKNSWTALPHQQERTTSQSRFTPGLFLAPSMLSMRVRLITVGQPRILDEVTNNLHACTQSLMRDRKASIYFCFPCQT